MNNYTVVVKELRAKGVTPNSDFYEYYDYDTPLSLEFERVFQHGQAFLDREDLELKIKPARLYFCNDVRLNAKAWVSNGYYLIEINKGTINWITELFESKIYDDARLDVFRKIAENNGVLPGYLLSQLLTLYCFYHEAGHLIQRRIQNEDYIEFTGKTYNPREVAVRHVRELDADWHAASCMAVHAGEFAKDAAEHKEILIMSLVGIFIFWTKLASGRPLYYEEQEHPHPIIRLCYMVAFFLETSQKVFNTYFDNRAILDEAILRSELLMSEEDKKIIQEYDRMIKTEIEKIKYYVVKIIADSEQYPYLSRNVVGREYE